MRVGSSLLLWAGLGVSALPMRFEAEPMLVQCHVEACAAEAACDAQRVARANQRCDDWNAALRAGRLPSGEAAPKPVVGASVTFQARAMNACLVRRTAEGLARPDAVLACGDDLRWLADASRP